MAKQKKTAVQITRIKTKTINALVAKHGARRKSDITRGVTYCAKVWDFGKSSPEEFSEFCLKYYTPPGDSRNDLVGKFDYFINSITGYFMMMVKSSRRGMDIADTPLTPADELFGAFSAGTHLSEDLREFNIAAFAQLNFGTDDLTPPRSRVGWAERRLSTVGRESVPAKLVAEFSKASTAVQAYASAFNIYLDRLKFSDPDIVFPENTRLISHWGLRDYMTGLNGSKHALKKQAAIRDIMRRIVDGALPEQIIDNPDVRWEVGADVVISKGKRKRVKPLGAKRWEYFKDVMDARRKIDPYTRYGNIIDNKFKAEREIPEERIVGFLKQILSSKTAAGVARYVETKLGRPIEPHDIHFRAFQSAPRAKSGSASLKKRFPDAASLTRAIPGVLRKLGFEKSRAEWIGSKIRVDNSRSAGHAWRPATAQDIQLLRCRVNADGITDQDFSVFMHELGHCVEGVLSTYEMDYHSLWSVPNTAFTEGFAFTFQDRANFVLGKTSKENSDITILQRYWEAYEIAGPALVEIEFFHWLYKNPRATAKQMNRKVREIGDDIWARYYARILGDDGYGLMSIYSHMLWCWFYLADYPMGYIIAYQVRKYLKDKNLAEEMERMCRTGAVYPEQWMRAAVGESISVRPLLADTAAALKALGLPSTTNPRRAR